VTSPPLGSKEVVAVGALLASAVASPVCDEEAALELAVSGDLVPVPEQDLIPEDYKRFEDNIKEMKVPLKNIIKISDT
ncbi:Hypothetical predicted protein, partial [Marmota monax]